MKRGAAITMISERYRLVILAIVLICCFCLPAIILADSTEMTLDQAREFFLKHNFDILINQYEIKKSEADLQGAKLFPNPALSVNYTGLETSGLRIGDNTQSTYRLDQLIELGGKRGLRASVASENLEASKLSHRDVMRNLLTGFYSLYYNLSLDLLNVALAKEELAQSDRTQEIAEKRFNAGFLSAADYTKLKIARLDIENNLITIENQYKNGTEQFRLLIGSPNPVIPSQGQIRDSFPEYGEEDLMNKAYQNRSDLLALQSQLKSEDYSVALAKATAIPDLTVGAEYENFGSQQKPGVGFGISLNIPLFNRNQGEIAHRRAELRQTEFQIEKTKNQIQSDVRIALQNYATSLKIYRTYRQKKTDVETLLLNSEKAFSLGGITVLDLLDTRKTYKEFMTKYNQSIVQCNLNDELIRVFTGELPWLER
jgi:cobalt-zinc-cadmium efflux system outer membrane protein